MSPSLSRRRALEKERQEVIRWMEGFEWESGHMVQVARLTGMIFNELASLHGLGPEARRLLDLAALTHDVGFSRGQAGHHKESSRIIRSGLNLPSLKDREIQIMIYVQPCYNNE